jgi:Glucodextranase, domain B
MDSSDTHQDKQSHRTRSRARPLALGDRQSSVFRLMGSAMFPGLMKGASSRYALATAVVVLALMFAGCGSTTTTTTKIGGEVSVVVTSPTSGSVIAGNSVTVRGTVSPSSATVQVQGKPAAVGNGVFTAAAELHGGRTTVDVIGSAAGDTPGSTSVVVVQQGSGSNGSSKRKSGQSNATPAVAHESPGQSGGQTPCGGELTVGPDTTCAFAEDVRAKYLESGSGTYEVYSPVTERTYTMTCVGGATVVCTGGNHASVYFP